MRRSNHSEKLFRKSLTQLMMRPAAASTSASFIWELKLKRIADRSNSSGSPIACKTGEGSSDPLEQAEPVEQAIPARSSFISSKSAWQPGNERLTTYGEAFSGQNSGPLTTQGDASVHSFPTKRERSWRTWASAS